MPPDTNDIVIIKDFPSKCSECLYEFAFKLWGENVALFKSWFILSHSLLPAVTILIAGIYYSKSHFFYDEQYMSYGEKIILSKQLII